MLMGMTFCATSVAGGLGVNAAGCNCVNTNVGCCELRGASVSRVKEGYAQYRSQEPCYGTILKWPLWRCCRARSSVELRRRTWRPG